MPGSAGKPSYRTLPSRPPPVPRRHSRRGAGGEAPGKTNLWSPPSPEGKGVGGDRGRENSKGRVDRQPLGQAPRRGIATSPPTSSAASHPAPGMQGAKPPAKLTYGLPLPAGKSALRARVGGIGAEKQAEGRQTGNHPVKPPPGIPPPPAASAPPGASSPIEHYLPRPPPVPHRHSRRGAGGEAPGKTNL